MIESLTTLLDDSTGKLFLAAFLGSLLGFERELARKDPSLRTFMLIALGSCAFSLISQYATVENTHADPGRIAAQIVVGIGFLGAGTIFKSRDRVLGLTTAALMWVTAAIGTAVGFNRTDIAFKATIIALSFMIVLSLVHKLIAKMYGDEEKPSQKGYPG